MELHTYTDLWRQQRRIHAIQDIPLPVPVPAVQLAAAVAAAIVWIPLLAAVGVPSVISATLDTYHTGVNTIVLVGPPIALAWLVGRPVRHHLTVGQLGWSAARYLLTPKRLHRLGELREPDRLRLAGPVWIARPPDGPPPRIRGLSTIADRLRRELAAVVVALAALVLTAMRRCGQGLS